MGLQECGRYNFLELNFENHERDAALATADSGWLTLGERIVEAVAAFNTFLGHGCCKHLSPIALLR